MEIDRMGAETLRLDTRIAELRRKCNVLREYNASKVCAGWRAVMCLR